jgi:Flp pilus assembly protein TadG
MGPTRFQGRSQQRSDDERGAELVEFALIFVLLIALVYGIIFYGLLLGAKVTLTQAAADGARAGIVQTTAALQKSAAVAQAASDVSWMGKGTCGSTASTADPITCVATEAPCTSNAANTCLTVTVTYSDYASNPLIPAAPGLGILTPSSIVSQSTLQITTPTS